MEVSWLAAVKHIIEVDSVAMPPEPPESRIRMGAGGTRQTFGGGSRSHLTDSDILTSNVMGIMEPSSPDDRWRGLDLDANALAQMQPYRLVELLADLSPDISRALWDFLRMCNPGWEPEVDKGPAAASMALKDYIKYIKDLYGSFDVPINRLYVGGFLRGAFFGEQVLARDGKSPVDLVTPDPQSARFKKVQDPVRGKIWQLGQMQRGVWVPLTSDTIKYIPIDPMPDSPYGRPLATPALFTSIFLIGLLHDLRRVVAQQGYPRLDIELSLDELTKGLDEDLVADDVAFREYVTAAVGEVQALYSTLQPDDAFIHTSAVKVNRPVGAVDSSSLGAVGGLISALERQVIRALKTMPLLMGVNEATSETHANRQWEVYAQGIKALQHLNESMMEYMLGVALQSLGYAATVKFRFAELRASEEQRDALTIETRVRNNWNMYRYGWISHNAAAGALTGAPADYPSGPRLIEKTLGSPALLAATTATEKAKAKAAANPPASNPPAAPADAVAAAADAAKKKADEAATKKILIPGPAGERLAQALERWRTPVTALSSNGHSEGEQDE